MRANEQQTQAQEDFLEMLKKGHTPVSVFLVNGIRLKGYIEAFDQYVLMLKSETDMQTIYKHAISTVQEDIGKPPPITSRDASGRQDGEGKRARYTSHRKVRSMRPDDE
jgi:host factor-I protein